MAALRLPPASQAQVDAFRSQLCAETEQMVGSRFPEQIAELDALLKDPVLNLVDPGALRAELDIPLPDPERDAQRQKEKKEKEKGDDKKDDDDKGPPCGPVSSNAVVLGLVQRVTPRLQRAKEELGLVSVWVQLQVPRIEDGNNFGVAVQEKVFELMTASRTKLEGFQTHISKYFSERGDAVAKAAKNPHVGDYRQLVHELDEAEFAELRLMVMEIRNLYAVLYDIVLKNFEKIKKPRGETKGMIY
ncbi:proteasome activator complex subunit 1 [Alligator mississippiensis]|uniref:proteasome activator complex subunit 1 n=1 Tax=Alligator mississippiensis TaxID=8496 RepID=UPI0003D0E4E5|nr:proteasome activator complex subunit 1 [Alligator mississippiensis]